MHMGHGFVMTIGSAALRAGPRAALCCLILAGCNGMDQTWATGIPEPEVEHEAPVPTPDEPPEVVEPAPEPDAPIPDAPDPDITGVTPVDVETEEEIPVIPTPVADAGTTPDADPDPPVVAFDCSTVPAAPVTFETLGGFTSSEDFAFDELGNYIGVDDNANLVRISKTGEKQLWLPSIGGTAGMGMLPDGSVVICDVGEGALKRVYPNGAISVVLGGLLYPNGLDIGPDGFIYVAENAGGRVRRVNPDTGEFTVVALGLRGPNGVAFTNDPSLLYVGSFEGSGVYKLELPAPGELGHASVFARPNGSDLSEPIIACPDNQEGLECDTEYYGIGRCQALANVVDCLPVDPCSELPDGTECSYPAYGSCEAGRCVEAPNPCDGLAEGDECQDVFGSPGVCQTSFGELSCAPPNPCDGLEPGQVCEDPIFGSGVCESDSGYTYCSVPDPCEGRVAGDACEDPFYGAGICTGEDEYLYCQPPNPCEGAEPGTACEDPWFGTGECVTDGEYAYCQPPNVCEGLEEGASCSDVFTPEGRCLAYDDGLFCVPPSVCDDLAEGDPCNEFGFQGICVSDQAHLYCGYPDVCDSLTEGDPCSNEFIENGTCQDQGGRLLCTPPNPCDGLNEGDACTDPNLSVGDGVCMDYYADGTLSCMSVVCVGVEEGARCDDPQLGAGRCYGGVCYGGSVNGPGGIDGMGVDACGNVYATEYVHGNVWRISPAGEIELLAELPSGWIPNVKWGRDLGGFSSQVMYVTDRDEGRLFALSVGVPGATEFYSSQP
jgi:sugar lactone lactonase YvrE